jgi:hypothetical protein
MPDNPMRIPFVIDNIEYQLGVVDILLRAGSVDEIDIACEK